MSKKYPDVIYLQDCGDEITWCEDEITEGEIISHKYYRADKKDAEITILIAKLITDEITWCEDEITELESANRWIPCDERLPELNKLVNVTYKYKKEVSVSAAYHHGNNLWSIHGVTHWRPLPPAPNGEE